MFCCVTVPSVSRASRARSSADPPVWARTSATTIAATTRTAISMGSRARSGGFPLPGPPPGPGGASADGGAGGAAAGGAAGGGAAGGGAAAPPAAAAPAASGSRGRGRCNVSPPAAAGGDGVGRTCVASGGATSTLISVVPTRSVPVSDISTVPLIRRPSTQVPLREPRSSTDTPRSAGRTTACRRESSGSSITRSTSPRPITTSPVTSRTCPAAGPEVTVRVGTAAGRA